MGTAGEFPSPPFLRSLFCLELRWAPTPFLIPYSNSLNPARPSVHLRLALLPQKTSTAIHVFSQLQQPEPPPGQLPAHLPHLPPSRCRYHHFHPGPLVRNSLGIVTRSLIGQNLSLKGLTTNFDMKPQPSAKTIPPHSRINQNTPITLN